MGNKLQPVRRFSLLSCLSKMAAAALWASKGSKCVLSLSFLYRACIMG